MPAATPAGPLTRVAWTPVGSGTQRLLAGFLQTLDLDADQLHQAPDALARLRSGQLQAVLVHGLLPPPELADTVQRLAQHQPAFLQTWFPPAFHAWFYGRNLNLCAPDQLAHYFDEAALFNAQLAQLLPGGADLQTRLIAVLSALHGGRPVAAAPGPQPGQAYMFTTLRAHLPQGHIPAHFDNEMRLRPSYQHLARTLQPHTLSFVLAFSQAEAGGALEVFDLRCEPGEARLLNDDDVRDKPDTGALASVAFRLPAGSMIVLDSGRYLHRLSPVQGARTRWSACSFMALDRAGHSLCCWG